MLRVDCACGRSFQANRELAGKSVNCPACGRVIRVPALQAERTAGGVVVACRCGQRFQAAPHLLGKRIYCPSCGGPLDVPQAAEFDEYDLGTAALLATMTAPVPRPVVAQEVSRGHGGGSQRPIPQARRTPVRIPVRLIVTLSGIGLAVIFLMGVGGFVIWWWGKSGRDVEAELARIQQAGEPTTPDELERYYALPPGTADKSAVWIGALPSFNTAQLISDAQGLPYVGSGKREAVPPAGQYWADLPAAVRLLEKHRVPLENLHHAARQGGYARYPTTYSDGPNMLMNYLDSLRAGALLLALESRVKAHQGLPHEAAQSIRAVLMAVRSLEYDPVLISHLGRVTLGYIAYDLLARLMSEWPCSEADLNLLRSEIPTVDYSLSLYRGLCGDRILGMMTIRDPDRYSENAVPAAPDSLKGLQPRERSAEVAYYLAQMSRYIAASQKPWPEALQACFEASSDFEEALASRLTAMRYGIVGVVLPPTDATFGITARTIAMRDAAVAAIAVELYRRQHGQLPESLDQLKPDYLPQVPIDPFNGQPLRYTVKGGKFAIYTAGMKDKDPPGEPGEFASRHDYEFVVTIPVRTPEVTAASRTPDASVAADRAEPASAERARSESSTRVVVRLPAAGQPVVVFQLLNFTGSGDPSPTAARALDMIPQVSSVFVDQPAGEIVVGVRGTSVNTAPMKQALERAGFEIGFTSYRPSGR